MFPKVATPYDQNPARVAIVANGGKRSTRRRRSIGAKVFGFQFILGLLARSVANA